MQLTVRQQIALDAELAKINAAFGSRVTLPTKTTAYSSFYQSDEGLIDDMNAYFGRDDGE